LAVLDPSETTIFKSVNKRGLSKLISLYGNYIKQYLSGRKNITLCSWVVDSIAVHFMKESPNSLES